MPGKPIHLIESIWAVGQEQGPVGLGRAQHTVGQWEPDLAVMELLDVGPISHH